MVLLSYKDHPRCHGLLEGSIMPFCSSYQHLFWTDGINSSWMTSVQPRSLFDNARASSYSTGVSRTAWICWTLRFSELWLINSSISSDNNVFLLLSDYRYSIVPSTCSNCPIIVPQGTATTVSLKEFMRRTGTLSQAEANVRPINTVSGLLKFSVGSMIPTLYRWKTRLYDQK